MTMSEEAKKIDKEIRDMPGLKLSELEKLGPCVVCGCLMLAPNRAGEKSMTFYRVKIERGIWDVRAVQQAAGLEMQIGPLARVMGPDQDLAKLWQPPSESIVHEACAHKINSIMELMKEKQE